MDQKHAEFSGDKMVNAPAVRVHVVDATATISPTAADSGKQYRCTHATPTFNLPPSAGCRVGVTVFWVQFSTSTAGEVDADGTDLIEGMSIDGTDFTTLVFGTSGGIIMPRYVVGEFRYVAAGRWALIGAWWQV